MLELTEVTRRVGGELHLDRISLRLERGSLNVLLGPTLAGKTSLMRVMAGLDPPSSGTVSFNDVDVTGRPVRERNVAMVYQQFINYPGLSVRENIASPLRVRGANKRMITTEVARAAALLRLEPYLDRKPSELSGGQQQRVALARAIVKKADLVLLDEPLANLDYKLREELREELPRLFADSGSVVVYATTEPTEALLLGGSTATMREGAITQFGKTIDVFRKPQDLVTAVTFSDPPLNVLPVRASAGKTWPRSGPEANCALRPLPDGHWTLAFRPHHLRLGEGGPRALRFMLNVVSSEITGSESYVHLAFGDLRWVMLAHGVQVHPAGATLTAHVEPERVMTFDQDGLAVTLREAA
ncbi:MAG: ATP-binding cassette domain-containing protein [Alphaproteobacteria bacterium]|nr:ATP-binding cassette domain-containing protein [Alphaproteobacteria bacterium]